MSFYYLLLVVRTMVRPRKNQKYWKNVNFQTSLLLWQGFAPIKGIYQKRTKLLLCRMGWKV